MMQTVVQTSGVIGGFGTLIVAWLVYQLGKHQAAATNVRLDSQHELDLQTLRMNLLDRRLTVLSDVREVWTDFMMHARPQDEMVRKLIGALQQARLIYNEDLVSDLDKVVSHLMALQRNYARQKDAESYYQDDAMRKELLEKQFKIEDDLWPVIQPLLTKLEQAIRVQEPNKVAITSHSGTLKS